jgi:carbamoyl-phosphate synthase small subunit
MKKGALVTADGLVFKGFLMGYCDEIVRGEVCFNTAMSGYQEIMTDPSYTSQIIVFTFPHIGNVGVNGEDIESVTYLNRASEPKGVVLRCESTNSSNHRALEGLKTWLELNKICTLYGVDTRAITSLIRQKKLANAVIGVYETDADILKLQEQAFAIPSMDGLDLASKATRGEIGYWTEGKWSQTPANRADFKKVAVIDFGIKENILHLLEKQGLDLTVFPCTQVSWANLAGFDGVFLSNGPGDPMATLAVLPEIKNIITRAIEHNKPLFGICLGHQMIAGTLGCRVEKLPQGHRGVNHPVFDKNTKKVEITAQNHGFAVINSALPPGVRVSHYSLFDGVVEGIEVVHKPVLSIQYHPESSSGPHDSSYLFTKFREILA